MKFNCKPKLGKPIGNINNIFDFVVKDLDNNDVNLSDYKDLNPIIVVNVASLWGLATRNYEELEILYKRYPKLGVLAFPSDQFGDQEYKSNDEIKEFIKNKNVTFPVFGKIDVNGKKENPLYTFLKNKKPGIIGKDIPWNYTKFLCDKGLPVKRFGPQSNPLSFEKEIKKLYK